MFKPKIQKKCLQSESFLFKKNMNSRYFNTFIFARWFFFVYQLFLLLCYLLDSFPLKIRKRVRIIIIPTCSKSIFECFCNFQLFPDKKSISCVIIFAMTWRVSISHFTSFCLFFFGNKQLFIDCNSKKVTAFCSNRNFGLLLKIILLLVLSNGIPRDETMDLNMNKTLNCTYDYRSILYKESEEWDREFNTKYCDQ